MNSKSTVIGIVSLFLFSAIFLIVFVVEANETNRKHVTRRIEMIVWDRPSGNMSWQETLIWQTDNWTKEVCRETTFWELNLYKGRIYRHILFEPSEDIDLVAPAGTAMVTEMEILGNLIYRLTRAANLFDGLSRRKSKCGRLALLTEWDGNG